MPRTILIAAMMSLCVIQGGAAQTATSWNIGLGVGASMITGTPERPGPQEGDHITGAGNAPWSPHVRVLAERQTLSWLHLRAEAFWNRMTTPRPTFNCVNEGVPMTKECYPAAETDRAVGAMVGSRAALKNVVLEPSLNVSVGAAYYRLSADTVAFPGLMSASNVRPIFRVGIGGAAKVGPAQLLIEAGLNSSLGDGGGADFIPITLTVLF
jgi:hypothetical protein